jgi:hypothetical protein
MPERQHTLRADGWTIDAATEVAGSLGCTATRIHAMECTRGCDVSKRVSNRP